MLDARTEFHADGASFVGSAGPETGLLCESDGVLFMVSPSVRVGWGGRTVSDWSSMNAVTDWLHMGGIARLAINDDFYGSIEALYSPQVMDSYATSGLFQASVDLNARLTPAVLLSIAASVRHWESTLEDESTLASDGDVETRTVRTGASATDLRGMVTVMRIF